MLRFFEAFTAFCLIKKLQKIKATFIFTLQNGLNGKQNELACLLGCKQTQTTFCSLLILQPFSH
jgi:hypothetical protein